MMDRRSYTYTVLRYVHDAATGECINVGLVMHAPSDRVLKVRTRHTIGRIKDVFPDLERAAFLESMRAVERGIALVAKDIASSGLFSCDADAATLARRALPADDSSLQWSPVGAGFTEDLEKTFERLYERFVARYDNSVPRRRSDDDVWRPVRHRLDERKIAVRLERKEIAGSADVISFEHTWKNGVWHAYEPISLDLVDADGIKDKARRWLGHLAAVADGASEAFQVSFILGRPSSPALRPAYDTARKILAYAPGKPTIYEEDEVDQLVAAIEDEFRAHSARAVR